MSLDPCGAFAPSNASLVRKDQESLGDATLLRKAREQWRCTDAIISAASKIRVACQWAMLAFETVPARSWRCAKSDLPKNARPLDRGFSAVAISQD